MNDINKEQSKKELEQTYDDMEKLNKEINRIGSNLEYSHNKLLYIIEEVINNSGNTDECSRYIDLYDLIKDNSNDICDFVDEQTEHIKSYSREIEDKIMLINKECENEQESNDILDLEEGDV